RRAVIAAAWRHLAKERLPPAHAVSALDALLKRGIGGRCRELAGGLRASLENGVFKLFRASREATSGAARLRVPGQAEWGGRAFEGRWSTRSGGLRRLTGKADNEEYFAAEGI